MNHEPFLLGSILAEHRAQQLHQHCTVGLGLNASFTDNTGNYLSQLITFIAAEESLEEKQ